MALSACLSFSLTRPTESIISRDTEKVKITNILVQVNKRIRNSYTVLVVCILKLVYAYLVPLCDVCILKLVYAYLVPRYIR